MFANLCETVTTLRMKNRWIRNQVRTCSPMDCIECQETSSYKYVITMGLERLFKNIAFGVVHFVFKKSVASPYY